MTNSSFGYYHFLTKPEFNEEFCALLTAEKCVTRYVKGFSKREWVKARNRNEALDCAVYALAALYILNPEWDSLAARLDKPAQPDDKTPEKKPRRRRRREPIWRSDFNKGRGWR